jgi:hypothetical protein
LTGIVAVAGTGSTWNNSGEIAVGYQGSDQVALGGCPPRAPTDPNVRD